MFANCGYKIVDIKYLRDKPFDPNKIEGLINIDLPKVTIKNVSKEEALEFLSVQFVIKAQKVIAPETTKSFKCSIIIPVCNRLEYTKQCLDGLIKNTPEDLYEVIIVDNASRKETKEFLKCLEGDVKIITNTENLGFTKACNQGAKVASGEYLVFLSNSTIPQSGWLEEMIQLAESDEKIGVVGSKLLYPNGTIHHAGVVMDKNKLPSSLNEGCPANIPEASKQKDYQIVTAACMLIKRKLFFDVGCFDERHVSGFKEADLCQRVGKKGKRVVYSPKSILIYYDFKKRASNQKG
jgi:GT2 family glycosyltransferase